MHTRPAFQKPAAEMVRTQKFQPRVRRQGLRDGSRQKGPSQENPKDEKPKEKPKDQNDPAVPFVPQQCRAAEPPPSVAAYLNTLKKPNLTSEENGEQSTQGDVDMPLAGTQTPVEEKVKEPVRVTDSLIKMLRDTGEKDMADKLEKKKKL